jgi:hypothetical protein
MGKVELGIREIWFNFEKVGLVGPVVCPAKDQVRGRIDEPVGPVGPVLPVGPVTP